jgi:hypothetical protein
MGTWQLKLHVNRYMNVHDFAGAALRTRLEMKADNTIIDAWPMKVSGSTPTSKTRHDFAVLLSSDHTGQERYAEWQLKAEANIEDVD